jgi:hypothetical protein
MSQRAGYRCVQAQRLRHAASRRLKGAPMIGRCTSLTQPGGTRLWSIASCNQTQPTFLSSVPPTCSYLSISYCSCHSIQTPAMDPYTPESFTLHVYKPLKGPERIRLMNLEPALSPDAPLRCTFQQVDLSDVEGQYEALSLHMGRANLDMSYLPSRWYTYHGHSNPRRSTTKITLQHTQANALGRCHVYQSNG